VLDKALLSEIEHGTQVPEFPAWLSPLKDRWLAFRDPLDLRLLRQALCFGYKAEFEPTYEQQMAAQAAFVETDDSLAIFDDYYYLHRQEPFYRLLRSVVSRVISPINFFEITPKHGPGAVFPPFDHCIRSNFDTIYPSIEEFYPFFSFFRGLSMAIEEGINVQDSLREGGAITASLTCVPKDSRGPRLICVHPRESVWIQQGLWRNLRNRVDSYRPTSGKINFSDQDVNRQLALSSSKDKGLSTLDLKEASDCISLKFFRDLFGAHARFFECCRASKVRLLDGTVRDLNKFAPMGNATTFPVQAIIFWSIARTAIYTHDGTICHDVYVFGDDIIVPSRYLDVVKIGLVRCGLRPNASKTFSRGLFRESCGLDAFNGVEVTPHRIKKHRMSSLPDLISLCTLAKNLRIDGYENTAAEAYSMVRKRFGSLCLTNNPSSQGIVEYVERPIEYFWQNEPTVRWSNRYQNYYALASSASAKLAKVSKHDWYHVQDSILRVTGDMLGGRLGYAFPRRVRLQRGWTPLFFSAQRAVRVRDDLEEILS
jgi:hypothetical protein